ncbi:MAG: serine hydrolase domain-containing protein [Candidatus Eisenbacteria bacterium]
MSCSPTPARVPISRTGVLAATWIALATVPTLLSSCGSERLGPHGTPTLESAIDEIVRPFMEYGSPSGLMVGITAEGERRVLRYANAGRGFELPRRDGLFEITSITKTFTATLLAEMIQEGLLGLDDPIEAHLPGDVDVPTCEGEPIRIRHLATHTAGLSNLLPGTVEGPYTEQQIHDYLESLASGTTPFCEQDGAGGHVPPGERMSQSEVGYVVLGMIIERVAGKPLADLLRERICDPLGLSDTRGYAMLDPVKRARLVNAYEVDGTELDFWSDTWLDGAGGLAASIDDTLRYLEACMNPAGPLGDALALTQEPLFWSYERPEDSKGIGMAWSILRSPGEQICIQRGWHRMSSAAFFWPERKIGMVLVCTTREHVRLLDALAAEIWAEIEQRVARAESPDLVHG